MLLLVACADPGIPAAALVSVRTSVPYVPDLGSMRDPRVAGCSPAMVSSDGSWFRFWTYDEEGRLTEEHESVGDTTTTSYLRWDGGCLSGYDWTREVDGAPSTEEYEASCDAHGNEVSAALVFDGRPSWTETLTNRYEGDRLASAEGSLSTASGTTKMESYQYAWEGEWLRSVTEEWTYDETFGVRITVLYTADELGQRVTRDETACAVYRDQDCVVTDTTAYTFDGSQHVLTKAFRSAIYTVSTDGSVGTEPAFGGTATFTAGDGYVPAAGAYTDDGEPPIEVAFDPGCD